MHLMYVGFVLFQSYAVSFSALCDRLVQGERAICAQLIRTALAAHILSSLASDVWLLLPRNFQQCRRTGFAS